MSSSRPWIAALCAVALVACSSSDSGGSTTIGSGDPGATAGADATGGGPADTFTPSVDHGSGPTAVCQGASIDGGGSAQRPIAAATYGPNDHALSCTECPQGISWLQGRWKSMERRAHADALEFIRFDGNTYVETIRNTDSVLSPNEVMTGVIEGHFVCMASTEDPWGGSFFPSEIRLMLVLDAVDPPDAFGNNAGDAYPCALLLRDQARTQIDLWCDFEWTGDAPAPKYQLTYCKEGSTVEGAPCVIE